MPKRTTALRDRGEYFWAAIVFSLALPLTTLRLEPNRLHPRLLLRVAVQYNHVHG